MIKETCLLALTYFMPIYTDFVDDPELRYDCGFVMTFIFLTVVAVNMCVVLRDMINKLVLNVKYCLYNKSGEKGKQLVLAYEARRKN